MRARATRPLAIAAATAGLLLTVGAGAASAAPPVYDSGTFATPATYFLDLDHGRKSTNGDYADAWYQLTSDGHRLITPVKADVVLFGASQPTYKQCKNAMAGGAEWDANQYMNKWFCAHTNKGRVDRFKVMSATDTELVLKFTTWS